MRIISGGGVFIGPRRPRAGFPAWIGNWSQAAAAARPNPPHFPSKITGKVPLHVKHSL